MKTKLNRLTLGILASCCVIPAWAQDANNNNSATPPEDTEVIQVRGIRASVTQSLNNKRFSNSVLDSVTAEDIGDFPDKNIGDALQRIPGVTVSRGFGEVDGVTIRGTAPEHSIVLLNGQNVTSSGWFDLAGIDRSFNFEMVAAEQISGMDIYKSVEAHNNEGGLGGTVNLRTRRPFQLDANTFQGSVEASHAETGEGWEPGYSGLYSWKNDDERFGVLVAHSVKKSDVVRETLRTFGSAELSHPSALDTNGENHLIPFGFSSIVWDEERKRSSSQVTLQFAATDRLTFTADYNNFKLENSHRNTALFSFAFDFFNTLIDADSIEKNGANNSVSRARIVPKGDDSVYVPLFNNTVNRKPVIDTKIFNLTSEYEGDNWDLKLVVGKSETDMDTWQNSTWWGDSDNPERTAFTLDLSGPVEFILDDPTYPNDHSAMKLFHEYTMVELMRDHEISYYQADFSYNLDKGVFTTLETGIKYQEQEFGVQVNWWDLNVNDPKHNSLTLNDFNDGHVSGLHSKHGRENSLTGFAVADKDALWDYGFQNRSTDLYVREFYSTNEDITAAYVKANFDGDGFRGNVGLRLVETDVDQIGQADFNMPGNLLTGSFSYTNFLPSINFVADLADNLIFRFAAGSTVSRPNFDHMKMGTTISESFDEADVGNPEIKPYKSDNYDIGLEWYFNEASVLGATLFHKNISDYIEETVAQESLEGCGSACLVTRYRNAGTAKVSGFELQYQQDFGNGFGVQANYTYTDSSITQNNGTEADMIGVSPNSYNLTGYYESDVFTARLAYNYRDKWLVEPGARFARARAFDQLDASLTWHATENIDVSLEGVNLLNEATVQIDQFSNQPHIIDEYGARYFISASYRM